MEVLFSPFRPPHPPPDAREEPAEPLVVEPMTDVYAKPSASLDATPENMSMLNTPDNGAPNGAATTHRGQVAPPASHTTGAYVRQLECGEASHKGHLTSQVPPMSDRYGTACTAYAPE